MTLHAAWKMDNEGASRRAHGHLADQVLRREGAASTSSTARCRSMGRLATRPTCRLEAMYRYARAARLYDGADEVHRQSVARQILRGYEAARRAVRARPDPPRGGPRALRRPARGGDRERLAGCSPPSPVRSLLGACGAAGATPQPVAPTPAPTVERGRDAAAAAAQKVDRFDEDRAWKMLEYQVKLGPRPAGCATVAASSPPTSRRGSRTAATRAVPGGLRNVVGEIPGKGKPIVLAAHYDTKDIPGFVGANDGAGGTAAMLEIARVLQQDEARRRTRRRSGSSPSTARRPPTTPTSTAPACAAPSRTRTSTPSSIKELVLLDFVADKDLAIPCEAELGRGDVGGPARGRRARGRDSAFPDTQQGVVEDDHTPFVRRGVPVDRPDRLQLPLLAQDLRRPHRGVQGVPGQERRGRARVPQEALSARRIAAAERSTSASRGRPAETEIRIAARPRQTVPPAQHVPSAWMRATALGRRGDEHLVEHDVVEDLGAAVGAGAPRTRRACAQLRSTSSASPRRPSERSAA